MSFTVGFMFGAVFGGFTTGTYLRAKKTWRRWRYAHEEQLREGRP